ncbi:hypothetical protein [Polynucleobacter sp.]|jgi:hypothetical protein|uniref:hypothetical protein n=1 Tax=Polynucleobacter sp. TaxID=2029855 RepID=UPI0027358BB9|nr:hypothetical protein [Polynucleobacter sp.]MDP3121259.1 hypothetical protein [Polynucleobacter sp.]
MRRFKDINEAWQQGYTDGWMSIQPTKPPMPERPGTVPDGEGDQIQRYYDAGYYQGQLDATKSSGGIT